MAGSKVMPKGLGRGWGDCPSNITKWLPASSLKQPLPEGPENRTLQTKWNIWGSRAVA